jgi:hypothetical protein
MTIDWEAASTAPVSGLSESARLAMVNLAVVFNRVLLLRPQWDIRR